MIYEILVVIYWIGVLIFGHIGITNEDVETSKHPILSLFFAVVMAILWPVIVPYALLTIKKDD